MAKQGLVPANNQQHKVSALLVQGRSSLRALARVYFVTEVAGQAPATLDAKLRAWPASLRSMRSSTATTGPKSATRR